MVTQRAVDEVFKALADPTRRAILAALGEGSEAVQAVAERFPTMSRPAVSKHLRILREAGLVEERKVGRQRVYSRLDEALAEAHEWLGTLHGNGRGDGLGAFRPARPSHPDDWRCW